MKFNFVVENQIERGQMALHIIGDSTHSSGKISRVAPMVFTLADYGEPSDAGPALTENWLSPFSKDETGLIDAFLQGALDAAWKRGLRPSQATAPETPAPVVNNVVQASDELLDAKDAHIADLRILAFHLAGIEIEADTEGNITDLESRSEPAA